VLVGARGTFRPVTKVNHQHVGIARAKAFAKALGEPADTIVELAENHHAQFADRGAVRSIRGISLARADVLAAAGKTVLISDYFEYYRLATYLRRCTPEAIAIVLGRPASFAPACSTRQYYAGLGGGILEGVRPALPEEPDRLRVSVAGSGQPEAQYRVEPGCGP